MDVTVVMVLLEKKIEAAVMLLPQTYLVLISVINHQGRYEKRKSRQEMNKTCQRFPRENLV